MTRLNWDSFHRKSSERIRKNGADGDVSSYQGELRKVDRELRQIELKERGYVAGRRRKRYTGPMPVTPTLAEAEKMGIHVVRAPKMRDTSPYRFKKKVGRMPIKRARY